MLDRATCLVFCFIAICAAEISACTVFYAADGDTVLVGNNEDYFNPRTKIWLFPAEKGRYGRVYFGWENEYDNFPMGGMNDQGLFFDWLAVPPFSLGPDKEKDSVHVASAFAKKMMETCSTVEEAVRLHKTIDKSGRWPAVAIVGDAMGNCTLGYRSFFYVDSHRKRAIAALGGYGQLCYFSPEDETVIIILSSPPPTEVRVAKGVDPKVVAQSEKGEELDRWNMCRKLCAHLANQQ